MSRIKLNHQIKTTNDTKLHEDEALQLEKYNLEENVKQIDREIAYFLKQLIKHFEDQHKTNISVDTPKTPKN